MGGTAPGKVLCFGLFLVDYSNYWHNKADIQNRFTI